MKWLYVCVCVCGVWCVYIYIWFLKMFFLLFLSVVFENSLAHTGFWRHAGCPGRFRVFTANAVVWKLSRSRRDVYICTYRAIIILTHMCIYGVFVFCRNSAERPSSIQTPTGARVYGNVFGTRKSH